MQQEENISQEKRKRSGQGCFKKLQSLKRYRGEEYVTAKNKKITSIPLPEQEVSYAYDRFQFVILLLLC